MKKPSWVCTIFTQLFLCVALYVALNLGRPHKSNYRIGSERNPLDVYFISVRGGSRPLRLQTQLLKQMGKAAKFYKPRFIVNISELGKDDPLLQNGTLHFPSLNVPWYATGASKGQKWVCFVKRVKIPHGRTLDIIGLGTESIKDLVPLGSSSGIRKDQLQWLTRTLQATNGDWRIAVGFHSVISCEEQSKQLRAMKNYELLHRTFRNLGVDAYLSSRSCKNCFHQDGITFIGAPGPMGKEFLVTASAGRSNSHEQMLDGFLLHRVSSFEIVTYFVTLKGEVVDRTVIRQSGREFM